VSGPERRGLAALSAAATGVQIGAALAATRFVAADLGPASLALLRYSIGVACLLPLAWPSLRDLSIARRDWAPLALLGILQFAAQVTLLNVALRYANAAHAALIFASFPLQTMLLGAAIGREKISLPKALGALLVLLGIGITLGEQAMIREGPDAWIGEACAFAAATVGASCALLYRPYLKRYPALPVAALAMLASVLFLALAAAFEGLYTHPPRLEATGWAAILFIGISSGIFYGIWLWTLNNTTPTRAALFLSLSPVTATAFGILLLGEPATIGLFIGLGAVLAGLALAHWEKQVQAG